MLVIDDWFLCSYILLSNYTRKYLRTHDYLYCYLYQLFWNQLYICRKNFHLHLSPRVCVIIRIRRSCTLYTRTVYLQTYSTHKMTNRDLRLSNMFSHGQSYTVGIWVSFVVRDETWYKFSYRVPRSSPDPGSSCIIVPCSYTVYFSINRFINLLWYIFFALNEIIAKQGRLQPFFLLLLLNGKTIIVIFFPSKLENSRVNEYIRRLNICW